jgi:hypothetical protein
MSSGALALTNPEATSSAAKSEVVPCRTLCVPLPILLSNWTALAQPTSPSPLHSELTQDDIARRHPNWFSEYHIRYKPCPSSVVFPNGRHACIGLP